MNHGTPSSYTSFMGGQKQLAASPAPMMSLKEAHECNLRSSTYVMSSIHQSPKSPSIPIKSGGVPSLHQHRQLLEKAAAAVEFQDLQFFNRVVTGIKTSTEKQYESKELLKQNEICLHNILRARSDGLTECDDFEAVSDEHDGLANSGWESDDDDQFVLDL
ncbi:MAG: hypothetical protein SGBAC_006992 [Bacillariaceae sp.]